VTRFFFNMRDGKLLTDPEGLELDSLEAACEHATACARGMMAEDVRYGELWLNDSIEILDENGSVVATVAFRDTLTIR
jgi:hypothetical protein